MSGYLGDFTTSNTVYVYFNTFDSNDPSASVTLTGLATSDIEIYKNGSATQRSSDAGYTLLDTDGIDFDGNTGIHGFSIDLSNNTDAGFFAAGAEYTIVVASVTVDAATINFVAGSFSIERSGGALALIKAGNLSANVVQISGDSTAADNAESFFDGTGYAGTNNVIPTVTTLTGHTAQTGDSFARIGATGSGLTSLATQASVNTVDTVVDGIQTDLDNATDGLGAIKTAVDAISGDATAANQSTIITHLTDIKGATWATTDSLESIRNQGDSAWATATGFATSGALATAQTDLDTITGSDGVTLATTQGNYAPAKAGNAMGLTAAAVDAIWDEDIVAAHTTADTAGQQLAGAGGADATASNQTTIISHLTDIKGATWASGTDTLELIRDKLTDIETDTAEIGAAGAGLTALATQASVNTIDGIVDNILIDTAEIGAAGAGLTALATQASVNTIDSNVDAILLDTDSLESEWADGGRLDNLLDGAASAGDPWTTAIPGAYGAGTAGYIVGNNLDAPVSTVDTVVDGIQTDLSNATDGLGAIKTAVDAIGGDATAANQSTIITHLTDIKGAGWASTDTLELIRDDTNELQTDDVPGLIAALNDIAATDIVSGGAITTSGGAVSNVTLVATTTTNTDMRGTDSAYTGTPPTAGAVADAVWDEATTSHTTAGTFGEQVKTDIDAILADTNELQGDDVPGLIATAQADLDIITGADGAVIASAQTVATVTDVTNQVLANVTAISGDSTAADNLEASMETLVVGTATGSLTTTTMADSALTEATDDHYIGRIIIWRTGVLAGQATDITDYTGSTKTLTFTAVTEAPGSGDAYVIV